MKTFKVTVIIMTTDDDEWSVLDIKREVEYNLSDTFPLGLKSVEVEETENDHNDNT